MSELASNKEHRLREASARRKKALALHEQGLSYRMVGLRLGVCRNRAGHLIRRARAERDGGT